MVSFVVILLMAVSLSVEMAWCYSDGAPPQSCDYMVPGHIHTMFEIPVTGQYEDSPYTIQASWDSERKFIRVSVTGDTVRGFIIQGKTSEHGPAIGQFRKLSNYSKYQSFDTDCKERKYGPEASLTHTNPDDKRDLVFHWKPTSDEKGNVTFYATLVKTHDVFWLTQTSNTVQLDIRKEIPKQTTENPTTENPTTENPTTKSNIVKTDGAEYPKSSLKPEQNTATSVQQSTLVTIGLLTLLFSLKN